MEEKDTGAWAAGQDDHDLAPRARGTENRVHDAERAPELSRTVMGRPAEHRGLAVFACACSDDEPGRSVSQGLGVFGAAA